MPPSLSVSVGVPVRGYRLAHVERQRQDIAGVESPPLSAATEATVGAVVSICGLPWVRFR